MNDSTEVPSGEKRPPVFTAGRKQLVVVLVLVLASVALWDTVFIYPVKLFVVFLHEISHAIAAVLTGGSIVEIQVFENQGGLALTRGGMPFVITSAGYLGSIVLGGILVFAAMRPGRAKLTGFAVSGILLLVTLLFVRNTFGFFFGVLFAAVLGLASLKLPVPIVQTVVQWLGALSCLYAAVDIKEDLFTLEHRRTDAEILAGITGVPALFWAVLWGVIAVIVLYFIMRRAWKRAGVA